MTATVGTTAGMLLVWMNIAAGHEDDFDGWFTRQHVPERVGVPGFRTGARYAAIRAEPKFMSAYETDSVGVLASAAYKERLDHPTEWTQRVMPAFRDTVRAAGTVLVNAGIGGGGVLRTVRIDCTQAQRDPLRAALTQALAEQVLAEKGVARVRVVEAPPVIPTANSSETAMRGQDRSAAFTVVVDGQDEAGLERGGKALHTALSALKGQLSAPPQIGDYRVLYYLGR